MSHILVRLTLGGNKMTLQMEGRYGSLAGHNRWRQLDITANGVHTPVNRAFPAEGEWFQADGHDLRGPTGGGHQVAHLTWHGTTLAELREFRDFPGKGDTGPARIPGPSLAGSPVEGTWEVLDTQDDLPPPTDTVRHKLWVGPCVKIAGTLGAGGIESVTGVGFWAQNWWISYNFDIIAGRVGLGLGGSIGFCVMVAYNTVNLFQLDDTAQNGGDLTVALPSASIGVSKLKHEFAFLKAAESEGAEAIRNLIKGRMDESLAATLFAFGESVVSAAAFSAAPGLAGGSPFVAVIPIPLPFLGWGAELSLHATFGRMHVFHASR